MPQFDVSIIGNGILGLRLAHELVRQQSDLKICVIGPAHRAGGASQAAGAMLGCFGEIAAGTLDTAAGQAKFDICLAAHRRWPELLDELQEVAGTGPLHHVTGTHVVLNARSGSLDSLSFGAITAALEAHAEPWEEVDPRDIPGLNPVPDSRPLRAIYLPAEGAVDGREILRLTEQAVVNAGVTLVDAEVRELVGRPGAPEIVLEDGQCLASGSVVVAAGAVTERLLESLSPTPPIVPMFAGSGVALVARRVRGEPFETVVRTPNRSGSCGLHVLPHHELEYIGATNVVFTEPRLAAHVGITHALLDYAIDQLDQNIFFHHIADWRVGNRPVTLDGFPVAGWTGTDGLYVLSGTYRDGFLGSPVLAELAARELLGNDRAEFALFRPGRRPHDHGGVARAIDEYVLHGFGAWYEDAGRVPRPLTTNQLTEMFENEARQLYRDLDVNLGLPPEILIMLLDTRDQPEVAGKLRAYLEQVA